MRFSVKAWRAAAVWLAVAGLSCGDEVTVIPTQTLIIPIPSAPTAAPSASGTPTPQAGLPGGACFAAYLRVGPFGYDCVDGVPVPSNTSGKLPRGCTAVLTATPKFGDGRDVPPEIHGPNIAWAIVAGQNVVAFADFSSEPFNKLVRPLSDTTSDPADRSAGPFTISATVCGVTGTFSATVE